MPAMSVTIKTLPTPSFACPGRLRPKILLSVIAFVATAGTLLFWSKFLGNLVQRDIGFLLVGQLNPTVVASPLLSVKEPPDDGTVALSSAIDDSSCACPALPLWKDSPFGKNDSSTASAFRAREITAELERYTLVLPKFTNVFTSADYVFKILVERSGQCRDTFYAQLRGTGIEEVRFDAPVLKNDVCTYSAYWTPLHAGPYEFNVWLLYVNGSGTFEPSALQNSLASQRTELMAADGRLKSLGIRGSKVTSLFPFHIRYGAPLKLLTDVPPRFEAFTVDEGHETLQPLCDKADAPGLFILRHACDKDTSCRKMLESSSGTFVDKLKYIWKPHGCRLNLYFGPEDVDEELSRLGFKGPRRVLFVGDSVHAEEFCALQHFLSGSPFEEINCSKETRATSKTDASSRLMLEYEKVWGFYDSAYGWRDLTERSNMFIKRTARKSSTYDLIVWNDAAHSLEKNDVEDVLRTINHTAKYFAQTRPGVFAFRLHNYVQPLGPIDVDPGDDFHKTSMLLQPPRVAELNRLSKAIMVELSIPFYDSSVVHAARPEATGDKLHWGRILAEHPEAGSCAKKCDTYCAGLWAGMSRFMCERDEPSLSFWSMQISLSFILRILNRQ